MELQVGDRDRRVRIDRTAAPDGGHRRGCAWGALAPLSHQLGRRARKHLHPCGGRAASRRAGQEGVGPSTAGRHAETQASNRGVIVPRGQDSRWPWIRRARDPVAESDATITEDDVGGDQSGAGGRSPARGDAEVAGRDCAVHGRTRRARQLFPACWAGRKRQRSAGLRSKTRDRPQRRPGSARAGREPAQAGNSRSVNPGLRSVAVQLGVCRQLSDLGACGWRVVLEASRPVRPAPLVGSCFLLLSRGFQEKEAVGGLHHGEYRRSKWWRGASHGDPRPRHPAGSRQAGPGRGRPGSCCGA
jgi:hypothetical protein